MTTPKMTGMTPNSHAPGTFGFSPALLGQSPAALLAKSPAANFNSPRTLAALGVDLRGTGLDVAGNIGTQLPPDEKKKRELAEIVRLLSSKPGRISVSAVERLAKGMGLECYKELLPNGVTRLSLAAKIFLLDIDFVGNKVESVELSLGETTGPSSDLAGKAAAIFHKSLTPAPKMPGRIPLLAPSLSEFSDNLSRLYRTDKLSANLNCFTAITGIYQSLKKIYEYERDNMGGEVAALCFGNGRPEMHTRGKVGLSVDYWMERPSLGLRTGEGEQEQKLWRVLIEVEQTPPDFGNGNTNACTPVRVSSHWVSDEVKKPKEDNLFGDMEELMTDWLEPPAEELMDVAGDPSQSRPYFVARLDPPVVLPLQDQLELHPSLLGSDVGTLESILFPNLTQSSATYRRVYVPHGAPSAAEGDSIHRYELHSHLKPVFARQISEIPFSHPRDLLPIFRTLRQHTLIRSLLESCFGRPNPLEMANGKDSRMDIDAQDDLNSFLQDDDSGDVSGGDALPIDVALEPEHDFGLSVVFPGKSNSITNLQIQVGKNAELKLAMSPTEEGGGNVDAKAVEKALRASEDIGLVVEWLRRQQ